MSAMQLWVALFFRVLNIRAEEPDWSERDRFILELRHKKAAPGDRHGLQR